jgi:predicted choloylglycine hydrolase
MSYTGTVYVKEHISCMKRTGPYEWRESLVKNETFSISNIAKQQRLIPRKDGSLEKGLASADSRFGGRRRKLR